ncbi:MAG: flavin reductase family protein [Christensenellales bacterium]|jgi:flavin reductase (DIM6/NTAB) family NADH-FMN oxidoreductase RutF
MDKKPANFKSCLQPATKALISCRGLDGRDNALAVAYCCNCSFDPPMVMVGIVPSRFSHKLIKESGCFVVNLPTKDNKSLLDYLGSHSGRDEDKLKNAEAAVGEALKINAPILDDCPVNIECRIIDSIMTGSHEMFVGKIEYVHAHKGLVKPDGSIDFKMMDFL